MELKARELAGANYSRSAFAETATLPGKDIHLLCYEYLVMADMLVKLAEFEATPKFMDKVLARWDVYGKEGNLLENLQDVIDQLKEEIAE